MNFSFLISNFQFHLIISRLSWIQLNFCHLRLSIIRTICLNQQIAYQNNYLISSFLLFIRLNIHHFEYLEIFGGRIVHIYLQAVLIFKILCIEWQSKLIWFFFLDFWNVIGFLRLVFGIFYIISQTFPINI